MNLEFKTLEACCISIADGDHQPPPKSESGIPFVTISNISSNQFDFSNTMFVPIEYYSNLDEKRKPRKGDILYSVVGSFGIPVLIKDDAPFVFQRHIAILRPNPQIIDSRFLFYTMLSCGFYAKADAAAIGAAQRTISLSSLRSIKILLPSLSVQKHIADILSAYDDLIENNQKQIKLLEEAAQRLYKEWFVDLRFPGWENTKIVDGVPEGWTYTKLGKILKTFSGSTPSRQNNEYYQDGSIPWLKTKELNDRFVLSTEEKITETALKSTSVHIIEKESVIMAMYGATIGKLGISTSVLTCNQACCVFDLTVSPLTNEFLFSWLYHKKPYLISLGKGAAQPNLSQEFIQSIDIILPPSIFIEEYTRLTHPFFQSIKNNQEKLEHLSMLRNQLLKNLLH